MIDILDRIVSELTAFLVHNAKYNNLTGLQDLRGLCPYADCYYLGCNHPFAAVYEDWKFS